MSSLLGNCLEVELLGVLLSKQAAVAHVLKALYEILKAHASLLRLERALDVEHAAAQVVLRVEWILKVDGKWIVEEVGRRWRDEGQRGHLDVVAVALLVPCSID